MDIRWDPPTDRRHYLEYHQAVSPIGVAKEVYRTRGIKGFYAGCGALVAGNAVKAGVRFTSYDYFKRMLVNQDVSDRYLRAWIRLADGPII